MQKNKDFTSVSLEVCVSTLSCLTCWNRKRIEMSDDLINNLTRAPEMSQKVIIDILEAEIKLLKNAKFSDVYEKSTFFNEDGLYDQVKTIKNNNVKQALAKLVREWTLLYIHESGNVDNEYDILEKCGNVDNDMAKKSLVEKLNKLANDKGLKSVRNITCLTHKLF